MGSNHKPRIFEECILYKRNCIVILYFLWVNESHLHGNAVWGVDVNFECEIKSDDNNVHNHVILV